DIGDFEHAFQQLLIGNSLKRRQLHYDEAATEALFERLRQVFDPEWLERLDAVPVVSSPVREAASKTPVFIVGMPRSASTLVEQILCSHPRIQSAGEHTGLERAAAAELSRHPRGHYPDVLKQATSSALQRIGAA